MMIHAQLGMVLFLVHCSVQSGKITAGSGSRLRFTTWRLLWSSLGVLDLTVKRSGGWNTCDTVRLWWCCLKRFSPQVAAWASACVTELFHIHLITQKPGPPQKQAQHWWLSFLTLYLSYMIPPCWRSSWWQDGRTYLQRACRFFGLSKFCSVRPGRGDLHRSGIALHKTFEP